ncbi:MAG: hypothetical protein NC307_14450 [Roseburia sp.]|nr:hypothetical protein [Roseburia sp.]MCM1259033.1 hypothetical protein [Roseburia sp.]
MERFNISSDFHSFSGGEFNWISFIAMLHYLTVLPKERMKAVMGITLYFLYLLTIYFDDRIRVERRR